ncbi:hypothetical protein PINS_up023721 [Pythium insidiosum]|nr:hypothetical protein PINS_up023721 [Pythium insidiosum]
MSTGAATAGKGGDIVLSVGGGNSGAGGDVPADGGFVVCDGFVRRPRVSLTSGVGSAANSGDVTVSTAAAGTTGVSGTVSVKTGSARAPA